MSAATDAIGRCVFIGTLYELEVPSRDCHVASLLAMTRQGGTAMGTVRHTESAVLLPLRGRAWLSPPLQGQCGLNDGRCESAMPSRDCTPRALPRASRSGRRSNGNGAAHRIGGTTAASRTGGACPAPTGPVRIERRPAYDPFFILQYSLFIISSIPLRGMANHMTKRPEIPCLSCKFPQSRRICH